MRTLELPAARLRSMVQVDAELSEIFLRAFMLRRVYLMAQGGRNVVLIGSRHCARTLALPAHEGLSDADVERVIDAVLSR